MIGNSLVTWDWNRAGREFNLFDFFSDFVPV